MNRLIPLKNNIHMKLQNENIQKQINIYFHKIWPKEFSTMGIVKIQTHLDYISGQKTKILTIGLYQKCHIRSPISALSTQKL